MNNKFFWIIMTLVFTVVGHLGYVLFYPPSLMERKINQGFVSSSELGFVSLSEKQTIALFPAEDPSILHAVCPFDVSEGAVKISIAQIDNYWSLSIYSQTGDSYYSINDRQSVDSNLKIFVRQNNAKDDEEKKQRQLVSDKAVVDAPAPKGWVILRLQIYNPASRKIVEEQVNSFKCEKSDG